MGSKNETSHNNNRSNSSTNILANLHHHHHSFKPVISHANADDVIHQHLVAHTPRQVHFNGREHHNAIKCVSGGTSSTIPVIQSNKVSAASANDVNKKPPILPKRTNCVINLDKNRIRVRRKPKILPRPMSLPNGFNLLKGFKLQDKLKPEVTLDIALIQKLEDEIYKRKEDMLRSNRNGNGTGCSSLNCTKCSKPIGPDFIPNQAIEDKRYTVDVLPRESNTHPVIMLDSKQLEPLIMKYRQEQQQSEYQPIEINGNSKSILIVDNSTFYPVLMKYELNLDAANKKGLKDRGDRNRIENNCSKSNEENCRCIENSGQSKNIAKLFETCIGKVHREPDYDDNLPSNVKKVQFSETIPTKTASLQTHSEQHVSKFKRFIMQRRSLNLPTSNRRTATAMPTTIDKGPSKFQKNSSPTTNPLSEAKNGECKNHQINLKKNISKIRQKNPKLNWMLNLKEYKYHFSVPILMRKCKSLDNLSFIETMTKFQENLFQIYAGNKTFCWSSMDLWNIKNYQNAIFTRNDHFVVNDDRQSTNDADDDGSDALQFRVSPKPDDIGKNSFSNLVRQPFMRHKRLSVGSADVVKTWIYRRRYFIFFFFFWF